MTRKTKKTRKLRKVLLTVCCAALLVCVTIGATVAYLTSTKTVTNTFTVGNVEITLDEAEVDANGKELADGSRTSGNQSYHVFPNGTYDKDPTVTVEGGSEECYVRILVEVDTDALETAFPQEKYENFYANGVFLLENLVGGWNASTWPCVSVNNGVYEFRYVGNKTGAPGVVAKADTDTVLPELFTTVSIPDTVNNTELQALDDLDVVITAQAIQADGFQTADAAWEAFKNA